MLASTPSQGRRPGKLKININSNKVSWEDSLALCLYMIVGHTFTKFFSLLICIKRLLSTVSVYYYKGLKKKTE